MRKGRSPGSEYPVWPEELFAKTKGLAPILSIRQAAEFYGFTPRALRYYEQIGLITAWRNQSNIRHYDHLGRRRLAWIATFRGVGLSLPEIAEIMAADEAGGVGEDLARERLTTRRQALLVDVARIDELLAEPELPARVRNPR